MMRFCMTIICMVCFLASCHLIDKPKTTQSIPMYMKNGDKAGTASLLEDTDGVKIHLKLKGLSPGYHGFHVHEKADCSGEDFKKAGNHFNPDDKEHGLLFPKGAHAGDLKNIEANDDGKVDIKILAEGVSLLIDKHGSLIDGEGTALIVTSKPDDGMTQISGDSGERIICGEIKEGSDK